MPVEHEGRSPTVDPGARVAPRGLDFPGPVQAIDRGGPVAEATGRCAELFGRHRDDTVVG